MESSLSLGYAEFSANVGDYLGYGRTSTAWTATQLNRINRAVDKGYRDFLGLREWSFLRKYTSLTTTADDNTDTLPDDFGVLQGNITYGSSQSYAPIYLIGENRIREMEAGYNTTGHPRYACIRPVASDGTSGMRWEVEWFPTPDDSYTLYYTYHIQVNARLRTATPYPVGGMQHAETIMEFCLAAADRLWLDMTHPEYRSTIIDAAQESIRRDKVSSTAHPGYNGDHRQPGSYPIRYCTYNGSVGG